jgi:hypothetical protein
MTSLIHFQILHGVRTNEKFSFRLFSGNRMRSQTNAISFPGRATPRRIAPAEIAAEIPEGPHQRGCCQPSSLTQLSFLNDKPKRIFGNEKRSPPPTADRGNIICFPERDVMLLGAVRQSLSPGNGHEPGHWQIQLPQMMALQ